MKATVAVAVLTFHVDPARGHSMPAPLWPKGAAQCAKAREQNSHYGFVIHVLLKTTLVRREPDPPQRVAAGLASDRVDAKPVGDDFYPEGNKDDK